MAMLGGATRTNPAMSRWIEDELFPMMLDVEAKVERLVAHRTSPPSQREEDDRCGGASRGSWKGEGGRRSREDRTSWSRREREIVHHSGYDNFRASSRMRPPPESLYSHGYQTNSEAVDDFYDDEEVVDDRHEDHDAIEQLQQFLQESAAHQRHMAEVRRQRREAEAQYVPDTQGPVEIPLPSEAAPQSQPHKSRFEALVCLYGDSADSIVSMETNLQARFDRSVDASRPRYWPIIPLRF